VPEIRRAMEIQRESAVQYTLTNTLNLLLRPSLKITNHKGLSQIVLYGAIHFINFKKPLNFRNLYYHTCNLEKNS